MHCCFVLFFSEVTGVDSVVAQTAVVTEILRRGQSALLACGDVLFDRRKPEHTVERNGGYGIIRNRPASPIFALQQMRRPAACLA